MLSTYLYPGNFGSRKTILDHRSDGRGTSERRADRTYGIWGAYTCREYMRAPAGCSIGWCFRRTDPEIQMDDTFGSEDQIFSRTTWLSLLLMWIYISNFAKIPSRLVICLDKNNSEIGLRIDMDHWILSDYMVYLRVYSVVFPPDLLAHCLSFLSDFFVFGGFLELSVFFF